MVTKEETVRALLDEICEATESLKEQIDSHDLSDNAIHIAVADTFAKHKHLECLMEALKAVWNNK